MGCIAPYPIALASMLHLGGVLLCPAVRLQDKPSEPVQQTLPHPGQGRPGPLMTLDAEWRALVGYMEYD